MRVTVVGAGGNVGRHLCEELERAGHAVDAVGRGECDLARPESGLLLSLRERVAAFRSDLLVNAAAFTDVDGAETQEELAYTVNALGAELVVRAADAAGAAAMHLSTDFVFSGESRRPYDEFDLPGPRSRYARSKHAGEVLAQAASRRLYLVRVEGIYGRHGRNFVSTLARRLRAGQALRVDRERQVQPTWARALSRQLIALGESGAYGTYHAVCGGQTTWLEFAEATCSIAAELGHPLPRTFTGVSTEELQTPADRPAYSVLECRMLKLRGLYQMPSWEAALREALTELIEHGII